MMYGLPYRKPLMHADVPATDNATRKTTKKTRVAVRINKNKARPPSTEPDAFTIDEFCAQHRLSKSFFYKLKTLGLAPATIKLGSKVLITREAAAEWRAAREAETATK